MIAALKERSKKIKIEVDPSAKFRAETNLNLHGSSITSLANTSIVVCLLRFGTAIARLRAHQLDAYEGELVGKKALLGGANLFPLLT